MCTFQSLSSHIQRRLCIYICFCQILIFFGRLVFLVAMEVTDTISVYLSAAIGEYAAYLLSAPGSYSLFWVLNA